MVTREYTNKIMELLAEGVISAKGLAEACLMWMSEQDVKELYYAQGLDLYDEDEVDCDYSDDAYALASAGFGTDEDY